MSVQPCSWPGIMTHRKSSVESLFTGAVVATKIGLQLRRSVIKIAKVIVEFC